MQKLFSAILSFVIVFACVFLLSAWLVTPHMPTMPEVPAAVYDPQFWATHWVGTLLGALVGLMSARSVMKRKKKVSYK